MNQEQTNILKLQAVLPVVRGWIERTLEEYKPQAVTVGSLGFEGLPQHYPQDLLEKTKVITVPRVPFPPLREFGLSEFAAKMEQRPLVGITYKDTFFVHQSHRTESLHFHEMVHVVQWKRLGVDDFLLAYGIGLRQFGYEESPLEQMAYVLQSKFERRVVPPNLIEVISQGTDAIWSQVAPLVHRND